MYNINILSRKIFLRIRCNFLVRRDTSNTRFQASTKLYIEAKNRNYLAVHVKHEYISGKCFFFEHVVLEGPFNEEF